MVVESAYLEAAAHAFVLIPARRRPSGRPRSAWNHDLVLLYGTAMSPIRRACLAAFLAFATVVAAVPARPARAQLDDRLTERDRARLGRGELITRQTAERRGPLHLIGGTSFQVVDVPPELAWRALHDAGRFGEMLPGASESRQTFHRGNDRGVFVRHGEGAVSAEYRLRLNYIEPSRVMMFQVDERSPGALRAGWGFLKVQPWSANRTLLSFGVLADVGDGMLAGALRPRVHSWMLRVPQTMKRFLENDGVELYDRS